MKEVGAMEFLVMGLVHCYHVLLPFENLNLEDFNLTIVKTFQPSSPHPRDKKGWTQRLGLANVSPKGLYHGIRGWFKLDSGS